MKAKSFKEILAGFTEAQEYKSNFYFEVVEGSKCLPTKAEISHITKCAILECSSKFSEKKSLKLLVQYKQGRKLLQGWFKLDGKSAKRYKDLAPCNIDPSKFMIYDLHDPKEEYGKKENNYSWTVCRIKVDAMTSQIVSDDSDLDF